MTYREEMAEKTRHKIIRTAIKLFREHGYENVTVRDIFKAAGVSNGAFYAHFKSKESLIEETLFYFDEKYLEYYQNELSATADAEQDELEKLELFVLQVNRIITANGPESVRLYMSYAIKKPAAIARDNRHYLRILKQLIVRCRQKKLLNRLYTDAQMTDMLLFLNRSISLEWAIQDGAYSIEEKDELIHIFFRQIRAQRES